MQTGKFIGLCRKAHYPLTGKFIELKLQKKSTQELETEDYEDY